MDVDDRRNNVKHTKFSGQGTIYNSNGDIVQPFGPWENDVTSTSTSGSSLVQTGNSFLQNFDFRSNKYANLIRMIGDWVSGILN
jgi:hypothetical protein